MSLKSPPNLGHAGTLTFQAWIGRSASSIIENRTSSVQSDPVRYLPNHSDPGIWMGELRLNNEKYRQLGNCIDYASQNVSHSNVS